MTKSGSGDKKVLSKRVFSLDALRGLDIFFLFGFGPVVSILASGPLKEAFENSSFWSKLPGQLNHVPGEGFVAWDLIMPLFMSLAGVAIPFSLARYTNRQNGHPTLALYWRIFRRIVLLWIFGMVVQGNLLHLKLEGLRLYSNTLQAIAAGYLIASIVYLLTGKVGQIIIIVLLIFGYWGAMNWLSGTDRYGLCGAGSYLQDMNLAEYIDRAVLGKWRDGVSFAEDGTWTFSAGYHYTWILSSLTFGVTTLLGVLAGEFVKAGIKPSASAIETVDSEAVPAEIPAPVQSKGKIFLWLLLIGAGLTAAGWGWGKIPEGTFGYCPMIKILWTPSMTLFAAGLSFLLLSLFYLWYDLIRCPIGSTFFRVIGMNAITCYVLAHLFRFNEIAEWILYGTAQYFGDYYGAAMQAAGFLILWLILYFMYKNGKFVRL